MVKTLKTLAAEIHPKVMEVYADDINRRYILSGGGIFLVGLSAACGFVRNKNNMKMLDGALDKLKVLLGKANDDPLNLGQYHDALTKITSNRGKTIRRLVMTHFSDSSWARPLNWNGRTLPRRWPVSHTNGQNNRRPVTPFTGRFCTARFFFIPAIEQIVELPMSSEIKRKKSFGTATIDHFSSEIAEGVPPAINVHISFEEALKLHLGLGQLLGHLNGYNRKTKAGRRSAVNWCLFLDMQRITINEGRVQKEMKAGQSQDKIGARLMLTGGLLPKNTVAVMSELCPNVAAQNRTITCFLVFSSIERWVFRLCPFSLVSGRVRMSGSRRLPGALVGRSWGRLHVGQADHTPRGP